MSTPESLSSPREVVLIGLENGLRERVTQHFQERGWNVTAARNGPEGRRLVRLRGARIVVVADPLPCESGRLTCAKLRHENEEIHLVLIVDEDDHHGRNFAHFVRARVQIRQDDDLGGLPPRLEARPRGELLRAGVACPARLARP